MKGTQIVVPASMRSQMLQLVHEGHLGIEKCKRRARDVLYWPNMNRDIQTLVQRCDVCQRHQYQQPKEPMLPHDKPQEPWEKVGMDLFQLKGKDYLLLIDYHSNYPEFCQLSSTTAKHVIAHTKAVSHVMGLLLQSRGMMDLNSAARASRSSQRLMDLNT